MTLELHKQYEAFITSWDRMSAKSKKHLIEDMSDEEFAAFMSYPDWFLRKNQRISGEDWRYYIMMAGRGFGKTFSGAAWIKKCIDRGDDNIAICAPTHKDLRGVMVPAILDLFKHSEVKPIYKVNSGEIDLRDGRIIYCYSSETEIRGPNISKLWADELAKWSNVDEQFAILEMGVRVGKPQIVITTTPKKHIKTLRKLINDYNLGDDSIKVVYGSTMDNVDNLSESFVKSIEKRYAGSRLYQQEIMGQLLDDAEEALWNYTNIHMNRVQVAPEFTKVVIAVDPAGTSNPDSDETGIIVAGIAKTGHAYVIEDASGRYKPYQWAKKVVDLYNKYAEKTFTQVIAEKNFGGEMVEATLRTAKPDLPIKIITSSRGKLIRAEPVSAKYNQNLVHHIGDNFERLEEQMCNFVGQASTSKIKDDRLDALVFALSELLIHQNYVRREIDNLPWM